MARIIAVLEHVVVSAPVAPDYAVNDPAVNAPAVAVVHHAAAADDAGNQIVPLEDADTQLDTQIALYEDSSDEQPLVVPLPPVPISWLQKGSTLRSASLSAISSDSLDATIHESDKKPLIQKTFSSYIKPGMHPELLPKVKKLAERELTEAELDAQPVEEEQPQVLEDLFSPVPTNPYVKASGIKRRPPLSSEDTVCIFEQAEKHCQETVAEFGFDEKPQAAKALNPNVAKLRMHGCFGASVSKHMHSDQASAIVQKALATEPLPSGHLARHVRVKRVRAEKDIYICSIV